MAEIWSKRRLQPTTFTYFQALGEVKCCQRQPWFEPNGIIAPALRLRGEQDLGRIAFTFKACALELLEVMHSKELDEGKHLEFDTIEQGLGILWNVVDLYKDAESKINRSSYLVMALKFAKALEDEYDEHKSAAAAEEDWEYDTRHSGTQHHRSWPSLTRIMTGGSGGMDYSQFENSITELLEVDRSFQKLVPGCLL